MGQLPDNQTILDLSLLSLLLLLLKTLQEIQFSKNAMFAEWNQSFSMQWRNDTSSAFYSSEHYSIFFWKCNEGHQK